MVALLGRLLGIVQDSVISGGTYAQFDKPVLAFLPHAQRLKRLSLLPKSGAKFYRLDGARKKLYSEDFRDNEKKAIIGAFNQAVQQARLKAKRRWGDLIEDRDSRITFSARAQGIADGKAKMGSRFREPQERSKASCACLETKAASRRLVDGDSLDAGGIGARFRS
jgi:hypothetical protein